MNGTKDAYVECYSNLNAIRNVLLKNGNKHVETKTLHNVDHRYFTLVSGEVWNLADKKEIFSENAMLELKQWFKSID